MSSAMAEITCCDTFLGLLDLLLTVGNRLNIGTSRGDQETFNLRVLAKLAHVKSGDQSTNLLGFIVDFVRREVRDLSACLGRFPCLMN